VRVGDPSAGWRSRHQRPSKFSTIRRPELENALLARLRLEKAQAHRFAYIAIINRCLEQPGSKSRFACELEISQQHLSYILAADLDSQGGALEQRVPSPDLARQIASTLPLPPEEQAHLLAHMLAARALTATDEAPLANSALLFQVLMPTIERLLERVLRSPHPDEVRSSVDNLIDMSRISLSQLGPIEHPIVYVQICLCLAECMALRNQHATALYHAHLAQAHLEHLDPILSSDAASPIEDLTIRSAWMLGRLYADLRQPRRALEHLDRAWTLASSAPDAGQWLPEIARQQARAHCCVKRFSLTAVEGIVQQGMAAIDRFDPDSARLRFLLMLSLAETYLVLGKLDHAQREFKRAQRLGRDPETVGLLRYLELSHGFATLRLARGDDLENIGVLLRDLREQSERSGLTYRSRLLEQELSRLPQATEIASELQQASA
jgi:tetratricopeptide (TPR) repeat protein